MDFPGGLEGDRPALRRRPGRGSDVPPARHSLPLPFDPPGTIPNKTATQEVAVLFGGLEGDRTLEPHGCEPCALPSELQARIHII